MSAPLPTATLGRTGLPVTRLGFGTAVSGALDPDAWHAMLNAVLDAGINFIDTANDYGTGWARPAEEMIGRSIASRRSEYYLATKCGCSPDGHIWTRDNLFRGLHESLARLRTDYVDLMQVHNPTVAECEGGDLVRALEEMRDQGKVRWIGASTELPSLATFLEWGVFDTFQLACSVFKPDHEEWVTRAARAGAGTIVRGAMAAVEVEVGGEVLDRAALCGRAGLDDLRPAGETIQGFLLRCALSHPDAHTCIVGTTRPEHLQENVGAAQRGPLPASVYAEVKRRLAAIRGESQP